MLFFGVDDHLRASLVKLTFRVKVCVRDRHGHARAGGPIETGILDAVKCLSNFNARLCLDQHGHDLADFFFADCLDWLASNSVFDVFEVFWQSLVEQRTTKGGVTKFAAGSQLDLCTDV